LNWIDITNRKESKDTQGGALIERCPIYLQNEMLYIYIKYLHYFED